MLRIYWKCTDQQVTCRVLLAGKGLDTWVPLGTLTLSRDQWFGVGAGEGVWDMLARAADVRVEMTPELRAVEPVEREAR